MVVQFPAKLDDCVPLHSVMCLVVVGCIVALFTSLPFLFVTFVLKYFESIKAFKLLFYNNLTLMIRLLSFVIYI